MPGLKHAFLNAPLVRRLLRWSQGVVLPGFSGVTLYDTSRFFFRNMSNISLNERSAAVTYSFLTAFLPTLLFLFTLIPYLPLENVQVTILTSLRYIIPNKATYESIRDIIIDFMNKEQRSLLSVSVFLTLFFSSNGMMGLIRYFDKDLKVYKKRNGLQRRWAAIKLTMVLMGVVIAGIVAIIVQTETVNAVLLKIFGNVTVVRVSSLVLLFFLIYSAISFIFIYGPSLTHRFRFISAGAVVATVMCILTSAVFFYLVNNFLNYNKVYGSIGTLIAFFIWVNLNTRMIMIGYDLNVSILLGKMHKDKEGDTKGGLPEAK